MRKWLFAVGAAALAAAVGSAQPAAAAAPTREPVNISTTVVLTGVCAFPVNIAVTFNGTQTTFTDQSGNTTRVEIHAVEQDVFTANGKTLVGLPYTANAHEVFDPQSGEVTQYHVSGVISRVPLPGGDVFLSAGRIDFLAHPDAPFFLQPDVGAQGNIAGFCAALAP
jgi:hypothetical protein